MQNTTTEELLESLKQSGDLQPCLEAHQNNFIAQSLPEALAALLEKKKITRADVIRAASLNPIYGHQIFSGARTPSRNKLLAIAFGMGLSYQETNLLLQQQGYPQLYPKIQRDAIIIYGLLHKIPILDLNTELYENDMETLL